MDNDKKAPTKDLDEAREKDTPKSKPAEGVVAGKGKPRTVAAPTGSAGKD